MLALSRGILVGQPALQDLYEWVEAVKADDVVVDMKIIQPLRTYTWLLSPPQVAKVNEWIASATLAYAGMLSKMLSDKPDEGEGVGQALVVAGSSLSLPPAKKFRKSTDDVIALGGARTKSLMQFFAPKGRQRRGVSEGQHVVESGICSGRL